MPWGEFVAHLMLAREETSGDAAADAFADDADDGRVAGHGYGKPPPPEVVAKLPLLPNVG